MIRVQFPLVRAVCVADIQLGKVVCRIEWILFCWLIADNPPSTVERSIWIITVVSWIKAVVSIKICAVAIDRVLQLVSIVVNFVNCRLWSKFWQYIFRSFWFRLRMAISLSSGCGMASCSGSCWGMAICSGSGCGMASCIGSGCNACSKLKKKY